MMHKLVNPALRNAQRRSVITPPKVEIIRPASMGHNGGPSLTEDDYDLYEQSYILQSRQSLWAFRQYMDPTLVKGWFPYEVSKQLQRFYALMKAGRKPKLIIEAPPQHGKSRGLQDFIAWCAGHEPDMQIIFASFSDDLGVKTNSFLQRMMASDDGKYNKVFPETIMSAANVRAARQGITWARNNKFIEWVGRKGSFRNVTIEGQVSGKTLDLGIIDDPLKGRNEAQSKRTRDKVWSWLMDDFFNRFSENAGLIITMTRWHVDDPVGRFIEQYPDTVVIKFPALYDPRVHSKFAHDPRTRHNEPLFPEYKSLRFLMERKKGYTQASWQSLYQQSPIISGGGDFPINKVKYAKHLPQPEDIQKSVRYWDKAGTEGGGKRTAGVLMHHLNDGRWYISDVQKGQWSSLERERRIKTQTELDDAYWGRVYHWVEQEPGSGGKESAERTIANLAGHSIQADKVTGDKETRAEPYAAQWQAGNIILHINKRWNSDFVDEHEVWPAGAFMDQVDAAGGAFAKIVSKAYKYDSSLKWVG